MNRSDYLNNYERPPFTIHDWFKSVVLKIPQAMSYTSTMSYTIMDSCFIDGDLWLKFKMQPEEEIYRPPNFFTDGGRWVKFGTQGSTAVGKNTQWRFVYE